MRDPFPIAPPSWLVRLTKPAADSYGLYSLPLHIHEIIFATVLYAVLCSHISPYISSLICPDRYNKLSPRTRLNWNVHVVSFVQSVLICGVSLWIMFADGERKAWGSAEQWHMRTWGYTGVGGMCQSFALGYFLWDMCMCLRHSEIFGPGMLAHAVSAVAVYSVSYLPFITYFGPNYLLFELSSPFLNIHWFCDKLDLTGSTLQAINGGILTIVFFFCRIVWGLYASSISFADMHKAITLGRPSSLQTSSTPPSLDRLYEIYSDPILQQTGFVTDRATPTWLPFLYLASNTILNLLNVYWFWKMVQTIRARFNPPLGTKGTAAANVTYEPKTADGEFAKKSKKSNKDGGIEVQHIEVQRAVYEDGHSGLEVTEHTAKKSVRSRRKA